MKYILSLLILAVTSCASMNLEKCQTANWESYGERDASSAKINNYSHWKESCNEFHIVPDKNSYDIGYKKGIVKYCTYQNGYISGKAGKDISNVCPTELQEAYTQGFIAGEKIYTRKMAIEKEEKALEETRSLDNIFRERMLGNSRNLSCRNDYECQISDMCNTNRCIKTGKSCATQSDCDIAGVCRTNRCSF